MNRSILFFLIIAPLSCGLFVLGNSHLESKRNKLLLMQAKVIQHDVDERLRLYLSGTMGARVVASAFWEQRAVEQHEYEKLAAKLIEEFPEIYGVNELDAAGKIIRVYPLESNRPALGLISQNASYLKDSHAKSEKFWFSPPFPLYQGGRGFVCYLPLMRGGQHLGWLGVVISTDKFFDTFTNNEFGKNFHIEVTDIKTGENYIADRPMPTGDRQELLFQSSLNQFGREVLVSVWPKESIEPSSFPWAVPVGVAIFLSLIATQAFRWWTQREDARRSLSSLNNLLRLTVHDTASSLTIIKGYLEIMKTDVTLVPVERLSRHIGFVVDLLDQIKLVRYMSASHDHWIKERLPLLNLVLEVSEVMSERLRNKDILLRYDPEELAAAQMTLNRGLFCQSVLGNILSNAIMFSPNGSTIILNHRINGDMHEIDVVDRGPGVPELTLKQLKERKVSDTGSSFGLMIAQQVAELHGGDLQIITGQGGSNIVRVRLPV